LPSVVPATVVSAARIPWPAPVAITKVTIGPGVMMRTVVITRKAANSSQFMTIFDPPVLTDARVRRARQPLTAVLVAFFADTLDRDHALAFRGIEYDHTLRRASDNADALDPRADELAAVGDQHKLIPVLDRE